MTDHTTLTTRELAVRELGRRLQLLRLENDHLRRHLRELHADVDVLRTMQRGTTA